MAKVLLGQHPWIGKLVAIKVIHPKLEVRDELVSRFLREARAAGQVRHDNVVEVLDCGRTPEGDNFIVMEYLEGEMLTDRLYRLGPMGEEAVLELGLQICAGLQA